MALATESFIIEMRFVVVEVHIDIYSPRSSVRSIMLRAIYVNATFSLAWTIQFLTASQLTTMPEPEHMPLNSITVCSVLCE
jgi:hypothetical protein